MNLDNIVIDNLFKLSTLKENDNLVINNNELIIDNENDFQEVKISELMYCIVTTLFYTLHHKCTLVVKDHLLNRINSSIQNIFINKNLNRHFTSDEYFMGFLNEIRLIYSEQNISYNNRFNRFFFRLNDNYDRFLNNIIYYSRQIIKTQAIINGIPLSSSDEEGSENEEDSEENSENENDYSDEESEQEENDKVD